jgi:hypothetical protein
MRNLLSKGLVVFAGIAGIPAVAAQADPQPPEKAQIRLDQDPRIQSLRQFFQRNNSPAEALSDVFIREADSNGLDWRLLPGLALIETGGGKNCKRHNLFGWRNGKASFESFTEAIREVSWYLSNSRFYKDKSLDKKLLTYNKDPRYRAKVKSVMSLISPTLEPVAVMAMAAE